MEIKKYECRTYLFCLYILCKISPKEIGKMCNVCDDTIRKWLKRFNIIKGKKLYRNKKWLYNQYIGLELSPNEIAKICGVKVNVINVWLRKFNIKKKKPFYKDKKWLYHHYIELELSPYEIGKIYNISNSTIRNWLKIHKIPMRSYNEAQKIAHNKPENKKKHSDEQKRRWSDPDYRASHSGEKHPFYGKRKEEAPNYKGDNAGYGAIHEWVKRYKTKPELCELCGKPEYYENLGRYELSDKTGLCIRDINNFQFVHEICHKKYDKDNKIVHIKLKLKKDMVKRIKCK